MTFKDLSKWDIDLIKSIGIHNFVTSKTVDRYHILVETTLNCIHAKGYSIKPFDPKVRDVVAAIAPTRGEHRSAEDVINATFTYLESMGRSIVLDESKICTWSTPSPAWYANNDTPKKPWQF